MQLTFVNEQGASFSIEIDPNMELENVIALLASDTGLPESETLILYNGRALTNPKATMVQLGVPDNAMLLVGRRSTFMQAQSQQQPSQDLETMRLSILGNPELLQRLQGETPDFDAIVNDSTRFAQWYQDYQWKRNQAELERQREIAKLNADPYDVEAQRKIEELIRREAIEENMNHAMEYSPESFAQVTMLYIPVEVNGHKVKAFVDSGAQMTIMSPDCAEKCGIMRLVDTRFSGIARGAGEAKILGRVHSAQLKLADLFLPTSFSVMESRDVDLLFGLDMLKAHQACIDLGKNVLRIQGREVTFLPEHELPEKKRFDPKDEAEALLRSRTGASNMPSQPHTPVPIPGTASVPNASSSGPQSQHPEEKIKALMEFGVTRQVAISSLDAAGGNLDVAASLLF